jgi:S-adenosylmethionine hydrolase
MNQHKSKSIITIDMRNLSLNEVVENAIVLVDDFGDVETSITNAKVDTILLIHFQKAAVFFKANFPDLNVETTASIRFTVLLKQQYV